MALRPILGVAFGIAVTVGSTIGVGILRTPGTVALLMGTPALAVTVWVLGGCYALLGANYTAELATMLPRAGGPYVFARRAYGDFGGFVVGSCDWLLNTAALAFIAITFGEYAGRVFVDMPVNAHVIGVAVLVVLTILNGVGIRIGATTQTVTSLLTTSALVISVLACIAVNGGTEAPLTDRRDAAASLAIVDTLTSFAMAFPLVLGAYGGWNAAVYFAEEDSAPSRNLPRSLFGGVLVIVAVYVVVNLGLFSVLPTPVLAASTLPFADAMATAVGPHAGAIVTGLALLLLLGILNAGFLTIPRTMFAVGRDGLFARAAAVVNDGGTPIGALLITAAAATLLVSTGTFDRLLRFYAIVGVIINVSLVGALFILRRREPDVSRPFKAWGYPYTLLGVLAIDLALAVALALTETRNAVVVVALLSASYPIYLMLKSRRSRSTGEESS
jgi:APA family basic amino acid/polyamine antiporter